MPANRTTTGQFQKGQSGNPSGRPKVDVSIVALAKAHTEESINTLAEIMRDKTASPSARVSAASEILDRGHGKAPAFSTGDVNQFRRAVEMTDDELARIAQEALRQQFGGADGDGSKVTH